MKKLTWLEKGLFLLIAVLTFTACGDDKEPVLLKEPIKVGLKPHSNTCLRVWHWIIKKCR